MTSEIATPLPLHFKRYAGAVVASFLVNFLGPDLIWVEILFGWMLFSGVVLFVYFGWVRKPELEPGKKVFYIKLLLGSVTGSFLSHSLLGTCSLRPLFLYITVLSIFHTSEYDVIALANPASLSLDSFLLNHSKQYWMAAFAALAEFAMEWTWKRDIKCLPLATYIGLTLCVLGELTRKLAVLTAGPSFTHRVAYRKRETHILVTGGIFGVVRHPSYAGWFLWSLGTQILLLNPLCLTAYAVVSWLFFRERIEEEERTLVAFFGNRYIDYRLRVPYSGVPFVEGYEV